MGVRSVKHNPWSTTMQIFIQGQSTNVYDLSPSVTVSDLKELGAFRTGVPSENQVLNYAGHPLQDEKQLYECDVKEMATINLGVRILGGKVHGSLARAGKVKGQTPKVEAQEKKKPKLVEQRDDNNTIHVSSTLLSLLDADVDQTQM